MGARVQNDLMLEFRHRGTLVDALVDLGASRRTAEKIVEAFPDGRGLEDASESALRRFGATETQARRIKAAFRITRVCDESCQARVQGAVLRQPSDAADFVRNVIGRKEQEYFAALLLDSRQRVVDVIGVAMGSLAQVDVHPRELFREAVRRGAHAIIIAHNHPSGDPEPSEADVELTHRMSEVGRLVGIPVLDHIVVSRDDSCSLASLGLLPAP